MLRFASLAVLLVACSDDAQPGPDIQYTGELVDWDSTDNVFCGVFAATFQVRGDTARMDSTNPNGRFDFMIAGYQTTLVDITPPSAASQCVTTGSYMYPGIAVADKDVIATGQLQSLRMITAGRIAPFFTSFGLAFDATKAHVFVHVAGTPKAVSISAAHDTTLAFDGTAWAAGSMGANVYFPNVATSSASTAVSVEGGGTGTGDVPLTAGTFTYLTVVTN
jgi:hypothetical protein